MPNSTHSAGWPTGSIPAPPRAKAEQALRQTLRSSLASWAELALAPSGHSPAAHHRLLIDELDRVARGETDRLMLLLPPGSAKSTYASLIFPPWWFARHPTGSVIAASHTLGLARHFGRGVRGLIAEHGARLGYGLARDSRAAHRFATTRGGQYFASGVRGPVTGRRADLLLVDDPVRSHAEADSPAAREHLWNWYRADLLTRLRPRGRVVLIMTRWHPDDLAGRLLESEDGWRSVRLPALAEADDPLGRIPGAPLWPEWEDAAALARKRTSLGERGFASLFQQSPTRREGRLFDLRRLEVLEACPEGVAVRAWDLAATAQLGGRDPDWTAGVRLVRSAGGMFVVDDVVRLRGGPAEVEAAIRATASRDGREVRIGLPQDPGQAGRAQVLYLTRQLAGYRVDSSVESGAKETRAAPVASQAASGNLALRRGAWNRDFLEELGDFPNGTKDDQVDALARAFAMLTDIGVGARYVRATGLAR